MNKTFIQMHAKWLINMVAWCRIKQVQHPTLDQHYNQRAEWYHKRYLILTSN